VTVTNIATNETREATSSEDGAYNVTNLDPGVYRVTIEAAGFRTVVRERVTVETNARLPVDTKLELGAAGGEVVTVPTLLMRQGNFSELLTGGTRTYRTINGNVTAPVGTIFDRNGNPFPGNVIPQNLLSPVARRFFNSYPLPTSARRENNYRLNRIEEYDQDAYDVRIDHRV
jgi:hypothetical protein